MALELAADPCFLRGIEGASLASETRNNARMGKLRRLQDVYRFPGFVPMAEVRGVFGDP